MRYNRQAMWAFSFAFTESTDELLPWGHLNSSGQFGSPASDFDVLSTAVKEAHHIE